MNRLLTMPTILAHELRGLISKDELAEKSDFEYNISTSREKVAQLSGNLQRLLDSYLDGDVERDIHQDKRAEILGEKKLLQEKLSKLHLAF